MCFPVNFAKFLGTFFYKKPPDKCFWNFHSLNCFLLPGELIETRFFLFLNMFYPGFWTRLEWSGFFSQWTGGKIKIFFFNISKISANIKKRINNSLLSNVMIITKFAFGKLYSVKQTTQLLFQENTHFSETPGINLYWIFVLHCSVILHLKVTEAAVDVTHWFRGVL